MLYEVITARAGGHDVERARAEADAVGEPQRLLLRAGP